MHIDSGDVYLLALVLLSNQFLKRLVRSHDLPRQRRVPLMTLPGGYGGAMADDEVSDDSPFASIAKAMDKPKRLNIMGYPLFRCTSPCSGETPFSLIISTLSLILFDFIGHAPILIKHRSSHVCVSFELLAHLLQQTWCSNEPRGCWRKACGQCLDYGGDLMAIIEQPNILRENIHLFRE